MPEWPKVRLRDVLQPVERPERVAADKEYKLLGVRLDGAGAFLRETKRGSETSATTLYRVQSGDFIYSRLFAWRGAFGIIPPELDGCYASNEFPTFHAKDQKIDLRFLNYWFRLPSTLALVEADCTGSTPLTRNRYKESFFLALEIPLPPLETQRRIVAWIEEIARKIEEARGLRSQALESSDRLLISMAYRDDLSQEEKQRQGWFEVALGDVLTQVQDRHPVDPSLTYPNLGIYSFGRGLFHKPPIEGSTTSAQFLYRVRKGQFIYSRLFAFEGAYGVVTGEFDGRFVSNEYPTFDCNPRRVVPEFLYAYFKAPRLWPQIAAGSKGLGDRRQRVQPEQLLKHRLMLPPLDWQYRIAEAAAQVSKLRRVQEATTVELEALLPSVLARAFTGAI